MAEGQEVRALNIDAQLLDTGLARERRGQRVTNLCGLQTQVVTRTIPVGRRVSVVRTRSERQTREVGTRILRRPRVLHQVARRVTIVVEGLGHRRVVHDTTRIDTRQGNGRTYGTLQQEVHIDTLPGSVEGQTTRKLRIDARTYITTVLLIRNLTITVAVDVLDITHANRLTDHRRRGEQLLLALVETIGDETNHRANLLTGQLEVVGSICGVTRVKQPTTLGIRAHELDAIREVTGAVVVRQGEIKTSYILLVLVLPGGEVTTHRRRIGTRCAGQHVELIGVEDVGLNTEQTTPERSIDTDVVVQVLLPRDVGVSHRRGVDALLTHTTDYDRIAIRNRHRVQVLVGAHGRRTRQTDTTTQLEVIHPLGTKPLLLRDTPTGRSSGEEAPARTGHTREEVRTIVTTRQLDVDAIVVVVVQTSHEAHLTLTVARTANRTLIARSITEFELGQVLVGQVIHATVVVVALSVARLDQRQSSHTVLTEGVVERERGLRNTIIGVVRSLLQRVLRAKTRIGVAYRVVDLVDVAVLIVREATQSQLIGRREGLRVLEGHIVRSEELGRKTLHPRYIPAQREVGLDVGGTTLVRT